MTAVHNSSCGHADLLVAMTAFVFSIREHPTVLSFAGWAYKAAWPTFFRKIFVAGFLATELGYERRKSQFVFEWNNVIPPFSRFLITFYHFNSPIVRHLSDQTQRDNHIFRKCWQDKSRFSYVNSRFFTTNIKFLSCYMRQV